jgi:hypothetical protein
MFVSKAYEHIEFKAGRAFASDLYKLETFGSPTLRGEGAGTGSVYH